MRPHWSFAFAWILLALCTAMAQADSKPTPLNVVFMIGEDEYHTWETLPEFAHTELEPHGAHCTIVLEDARNKHHFPGIIEALGNADLLVLSTRRRLPPKLELDAVREHLNAGRPIVAIRTACHAFSPALGATAADSPHTNEKDSWVEFDPKVLGGHYVGHWDPGPQVQISAAPGSDSPSLLTGVNVSELLGNGSLYRVNPLDPTCRVMLMGEIPGKAPEPVAWTREYGPNHARIFYTSLGHPSDFKEPAYRRLLLNAIAWATNRGIAVGEPKSPGH